MEEACELARSPNPGQGTAFLPRPTDALIAFPSSSSALPKTVVSMGKRLARSTVSDPGWSSLALAREFLKPYEEMRRYELKSTQYSKGWNTELHTMLQDHGLEESCGKTAPNPLSPCSKDNTICVTHLKNLLTGSATSEYALAIARLEQFDRTQLLALKIGPQQTKNNDLKSLVTLRACEVPKKGRISSGFRYGEYSRWVSSTDIDGLTTCLKYIRSLPNKTLPSSADPEDGRIELRANLGTYTRYPNCGHVLPETVTKLRAKAWAFTEHPEGRRAGKLYYQLAKGLLTACGRPVMDVQQPSATGNSLDSRGQKRKRPPSPGGGSEHDGTSLGAALNWRTASSEFDTQSEEVPWCSGLPYDWQVLTSLGQGDHPPGPNVTTGVNDNDTFVGEHDPFGLCPDPEEAANPNPMSLSGPFGEVPADFFVKGATWQDRTVSSHTWVSPQTAISPGDVDTWVLSSQPNTDALTNNANPSTEPHQNALDLTYGSFGGQSLNDPYEYALYAANVPQSLIASSNVHRPGDEFQLPPGPEYSEPGSGNPGDDSYTTMYGSNLYNNF
jgi:hypothetical protein